MSQEIVLIIIGFIAGILAGMFGIGGGVVIVPALMGLLPDFNFHQATGTSLAALLLPVGIFAVISYYRKGFLSIKNALLVFFVTQESYFYQHVWKFRGTAQ